MPSIKTLLDIGSTIVIDIVFLLVAKRSCFSSSNKKLVDFVELRNKLLKSGKDSSVLACLLKLI